MRYIKIYVPHVWKTTTEFLLKTSKKEMKPDENNKEEQRKLSVVNRYFWKWGSEIVIWRWRGDAINIVYVTNEEAVWECTLLKGTSALF